MSKSIGERGVGTEIAKMDDSSNEVVASRPARNYSAEELGEILARQEQRIRDLEGTSGKGLRVQLEQMQAMLSQPTYVVELYKAGGRGQAMQILAVGSFAGTVRITVAPIDPSRPLPLPDFSG